MMKWMTLASINAFLVGAHFESMLVGTLSAFRFALLLLAIVCLVGCFVKVRPA